jgi:hypothetical protein
MEKKVEGQPLAVITEWFESFSMVDLVPLIKSFRLESLNPGAAVRVAYAWHSVRGTTTTSLVS